MCNNSNAQGKMELSERPLVREAKLHLSRQSTEYRNSKRNTELVVISSENFVIYLSLIRNQIKKRQR